MFFARKRRAGSGLFGFVIIVAVLYATGILPDLWARAKTATAQCEGALASSGIPASGALCGGVRSVVTAIDQVASRASSEVREWVNAQRMRLNWEWAANPLRSPVEELGRVLDGVTSGTGWQNSGLASTEETLQALLQLGPQRASTYYNQQAPWQGAMDRFALGQRLMDSEPSQGVAWMRQGAAFGEYGLLPQLSLGNAYMRGTGGVRADPRQALAYYTQAERSLTRLESSQNPAAQELLGALGAPPDQIRAEIIAAIKMIQSQWKN